MNSLENIEWDVKKMASHATRIIDIENISKGTFGIF